MAKKSELKGKRNRNAFCSFCRKSYLDVGPLVEGPGNVYICGECIELCQSIINEEKRRRALTREQADPELMAASPRERLARFLPGQEETAEALAAMGHRHFERLERKQDRLDRQMSAILLIGPARTARLFAARGVAHVLGVPFLAVDHATLAAPASSDGDSLLQALLTEVEFDVNAAQCSLVYVDGIDQPELAQSLAERLAQTADSPLARRLNFDVTRPLFLLGGTFERLDRMIAQRERHGEQPISPQDLRACGMPLDLGRSVRTIVRIAPLDEETLTRVLLCADLRRWPEGS
jgi:ATP-dependent protease Clp ATPase subunit